MNISSTSRWWRGGKLVLPQLGTEQVISDLLPVEMQRFCQNIISRYVKSEVRILVPVKLKFQHLGKLVCFSQKLIENKEHKSLHKIHFKSIDSSAVVELHKLTDYNSGHCIEDQLHFRFLLSLILFHC